MPWANWYLRAVGALVFTTLLPSVDFRTSGDTAPAWAQALASSDHGRGDDDGDDGDSDSDDDDGDDGDRGGFGRGGERGVDAPGRSRGRGGERGGNPGARGGPGNAGENPEDRGPRGAGDSFGQRGNADGEGAPDQPAGANPPERQPFAEREIVVSGITEQMAADLRRTGFVVDVRQGEVARVTPPEGTSFEAAAAIISREAPDAVSDRNHYYYPDGQQSDCDGPHCASIEIIDWSRPDLSACARLPLIGMVDTHVNLDHEALAGQDIELLPRDDARSPSGAKHGTAIAALLVGSHESRTPGLVPEARLVAADAFHSDGNGNDRTDAVALVEAMRALADRGVEVMNLSLSGPPNEILERTVADLVGRGIIIVSAAGNNGPGGEPAYPAAYSGVIAVTAVDHDLELYPRATRGDYVQISAPGVDVWTAASVSGGRQMTGTSYAVPFVSAAIARLWAGSPTLAPPEVEAELFDEALDLGEPGRDPTYGWGLLRTGPHCSPVDEATPDMATVPPAAIDGAFPPLAD
jgi:hypothetical protein